MVRRVMVDTRVRDLSIELFGLTLPTPVFLSPIGVTGICTPDGHGYLAAARASAATGVPMMASTLANDPLEAVANALGAKPGFFQLSHPKHDGLTESPVNSAEPAVYQGLVVTSDTGLTAWRTAASNAGQ